MTHSLFTKKVEHQYLKGVKSDATHVIASKDTQMINIKLVIQKRVATL